MQRLFAAASAFIFCSILSYGIGWVIFSKFLFLAGVALFGTCVFLAAFGGEG